jgi:hypothetical protein
MILRCEPLGNVEKEVTLFGAERAVSPVPRRLEAVENRRRDVTTKWFADSDPQVRRDERDKRFRCQERKRVVAVLDRFIRSVLPRSPLERLLNTLALRTLMPNKYVRHREIAEDFGDPLYELGGVHEVWRTMKALQRRTTG